MSCRQRGPGSLSIPHPPLHARLREAIIESIGLVFRNTRDNSSWWDRRVLPLDLHIPSGRSQIKNSSPSYDTERHLYIHVPTYIEDRRWDNHIPFSCPLCKSVLPPGFKQRVSCLQDRHANHYTTATYTTQHSPILSSLSPTAPSIPYLKHWHHICCTYITVLYFLRRCRCLVLRYRTNSTAHIPVYSSPVRDIRILKEFLDAGTDFWGLID